MSPANEVVDDSIFAASRPSNETIKVHMGLCVEECFVEMMMAGAGSNGMWG